MYVEEYYAEIQAIAEDAEREAEERQLAYESDMEYGDGPYGRADAQYDSVSRALIDDPMGLLLSNGEREIMREIQEPGP